MIDLSLAGLLGAVVGLVLSALVYAPLVAFVERGFRSRDPSPSEEQRNTFEQEMSLLRRAVLAVDMLVLGGIGYWLGHAIAS
jgi:hypothetical protein